MDDLKYRPFDHDDWGMIRNADGTMFATVRRPEAYEGEFDQHRAEETDPFAEIARKVIFFDHLEAENSALRSDNARLAKELEEARMWQPIEVAPKDGTFVLVHAAAPIPRVAMAAWQGRDQRAGWYGVDDCGLTFDAVRHGDIVSRWMPLPAIRHKAKDADHG